MKKMQGTTDWKNQIDRQIHPFENLLHMPHFSQKRSPAGLLVLENIRSPFYSLLTNREMLNYGELGVCHKVARYKVLPQNRGRVSTLPDEMLWRPEV